MLEVSLACDFSISHREFEVECYRIFGPVVGLRARGDLVTCRVNPGKLLTGIPLQREELYQRIAL